MPSTRKTRIEPKADPEYWKAFAQLMARIEAALGDYSGPPVPVYVAGGAASHIYTGARFSHDIDATLGRRVLLPRDLEVMYRAADGKLRTLYFDRQYNEAFGLMHEDAHRDSLPIDVPGVDPKRLQVRVLTPVDLAVSKLVRFADPDRADIEALARAGLLGADDLRKRAEDALAGYIGRVSDVRISIDFACRLIRQARPPGRQENK
ncbi:MAG TPA: DUF6036 family nucleotidyltransferase [Usitatibacter sp.]|nr:DUF6036 family nucleotidyltransferase [Usitatibacter sp.]